MKRFSMSAMVAALYKRKFLDALATAMSGAAAGLSYLGAITIHPALQTRLRAPRVRRASRVFSIDFDGIPSNSFNVPRHARSFGATNRKIFRNNNSFYNCGKGGGKHSMEIYRVPCS